MMRKPLLALLAVLVAVPGVTAQQPVPQQFQIESALGVHGTTDFFNYLEGEIEPVIAGIDPMSLLGGQTTFDTDILGLVQVSLTVQDIDLNYGGAPDVTIGATPPDVLGIGAQIPDLRVAFSISITSAVGTVNQQGAVLSGFDISGALVPTLNNFKLGLDANNLQAGLVNARVDLNNPGLGGFIFDPILEWILNTFFIDLVADPINAELINLLNGFFTGEPLLDISELLATFLEASPSFQISNFDQRISSSTGHTLSLLAGLYPLRTLSGEVFQSTTRPNVLPTYGSTTPGTGQPYHMGFSVSDDFINDILMVVTKSDLLNIQVDGCLLAGQSLPISFSSGLVLLLIQETTPPFGNNLPLIIETNPLQAPYIEVTPNGANLRLDDFELTFNLVEKGEFLHAFSAALDLRLEVDFMTDPVTGAPQIDVQIPQDPVTGLPDVTATITDPGVLVDTTDQILTQKLGFVMNLLLGAVNLNDLINPLLQDLLNLDLGGLTLNLNELGFDGPANDYLSLYLTLDGNLSVALPAPSPNRRIRPRVVPGPSANPQNLLAVGKKDTSAVQVYSAWNMEPIPGSPFTLGAPELEPTFMVYSAPTGVLYVISTQYTQPSRDGAITALSVGDGTFSVIGAPVNTPGGELGEALINPFLGGLYVINKLTNMVDTYDIVDGVPRYISSFGVGQGVLEGIAIDDKRQVLYLSYRDRIVEAYDVTSFNPTLLHTENTSPVTGPLDRAIYNPENDFLYLQSTVRKKIHVYDCSTGPDAMSYVGEATVTGFPRDMYIDTVNDHLLVASSSSNIMSVFDTDTLALINESQPGAISRPNGLAVHRYGIAYTVDPVADDLYLVKVPSMESVTGTPLNEGDNPTTVAFFNTGDFDSTPPDVNMVTVLTDTDDSSGPYIVTADGVTDNLGINEVVIQYEFNGAQPPIRKEMVPVDCDTFEGAIPGLATGGVVRYRIEALDDGNNRWVSPFYQFSVTPPTPTPSPTITPTPTDGPTSTPRPTSTRRPTFTPRPTLSPTPGGPTFTPTATPTPQDTTAPQIWLAGYTTTEIRAGLGGTMRLVAMITDPDVDRVEVYYAGFPTGIDMRDNGIRYDFERDDNIYGAGETFGSRTFEFPLTAVLEVVAWDDAGNQSDLWPYLHVKP